MFKHPNWVRSSARREVMVFMGDGRRGAGWLVVLMFCGFAVVGRWGQTQPAQPKPDQKPQQKDDVPDAPSAVRPTPSFPNVPPTSEGDAPPPASSGTSSSSSGSSSGTAPATAPAKTPER